MSSFPRGTVVHFECPMCLWKKAVLAYEQQGVGTAFCPHCQHLWELALPAKVARVARRKTSSHENVETNKRRIQP